MYESGMSKTAKVLFFIIVGFLAYFLITLGGCSQNPYQTPIEIVDNAGQSKVVFYIEEADTSEKAKKGLMFRESMPENAGMTFTLTEPRVLKMWMKNTQIPLDMLFAKDGKVIWVYKNAKPLSEETITSPEPADVVIEINAGEADKYNIQPGDTIKHVFFGNEDVK